MSLTSFIMLISVIHMLSFFFFFFFFFFLFVFFSSRRRHTRSKRDWSSDVCSSDLGEFRRGAIITSKVVAKKKDEEEAQRFSDYFDFSEPLKKCS